MMMMLPLSQAATFSDAAKTTSPKGNSIGNLKNVSIKHWSFYYIVARFGGGQIKKSDIARCLFSSSSLYSVLHRGLPLCFFPFILPSKMSFVSVSPCNKWPIQFACRYMIVFLICRSSSTLNNLRNPAVGSDQFRRNPPVCLLLAFRWQCVRGVFTYPCYTNVHLLTYLLTQNRFIGYIVIPAYIFHFSIYIYISTFP